MRNKWAECRIEHGVEWWGRVESRDSCCKRPLKSIEVLSSELSLNKESPKLVASRTTTPTMMVVVVVVHV